MKIGIITQPLRSNYGGILQNYALQQVLKQLGHTPVTIDFNPHIPLWRYVLSTCKSLILSFIPGKRRPFAKYYFRRDPRIGKFVDRYIGRTHPVRKHSPELLKRYGIEGLIVGSDQVWRPCYNLFLEDMFLRFARNEDMPKIAYAASFGVDVMELTRKQLSRCVPLLQRFDAVSVREASGVELCRKYFHVSAEHVLDPTLMLNESDYKRLCADIPPCGERFVCCYILDPTEEQRERIDRAAHRLNMVPRYFTAGNGATLSVEEWLSVFRDAAYVITDSFHGTVFSIIFRNPFISIANKSRGTNRFRSLLNLFQMENRLISSMNELPDELFGTPVNWQEVDKILSDIRTKSETFLQNALN